MAIDRTAPVPPATTPTLDAFVQQIMPIAVKLGIPMLVIVGVDPQTGEMKLYGSQEARTATRTLVAEKFLLADVGEAAWPE